MIHDELLMVRGFTVNSVDISFMLHELLRHKIGSTLFILQVLTAIHGLYVYSCVILIEFLLILYDIFGGTKCLCCLWS